MSFGSRQAVRLGRGLAGGLVLGVLLASPAGAGSYPETALSMALSTPPELVDESSLLFQLPSRAGISPTQLFAFSTSPYYYSSDTNSLGIVGQTHGQAIFVLVQPSFLISAQPAFQAGWGGAWKTLRLGAAARASKLEGESSRYQAGSTTSWNIDETQQEIWEASVGLGFGGDRFDLDLAADVQRFDASSEQSRSGYDTLTVNVESQDEVSAGISGRFLARFGEVELTGAGGWGRIDGGMVGVGVGSGGSDSVTASRMLENWFGGIAVHFPTARIDQVTIAAHWSHRETVPEYSFFIKSIQVRRQLAISVQEQPWRTLHFQAGISVRYEDQAFEQGYDSYYDDFWYETKTTALRADFGWGVSYSWKVFEGRAALRETLPFQDLFAAVDFFVRL